MVWTEVWYNLSQMQGLEDLHITLLLSGRKWESLTHENATAVIEPIKAVTKPKLFELTVPDNIGANDSPWTSLPCYIKTIPSATQFMSSPH